MRYHFRGRKSLLFRILGPMIAFAVVQIVVFLSLLMASGGFSSVKSSSYNIILERTENRKNYLENMLSQKTPLAYETVSRINEITEGILEEMNLTAADVGKDKELNERILSECTASLISLLRQNRVNDVFLILDTGELYNKHGKRLKAGVYLRDTDAGENSASDNKDIFMEMGSSKIARDFGFPLDYGWSLYLDVTDDESGSRDFFYEPVRSYERNAKTPLYSLGYWSRVSSLSDSQQGSIKYTLPLVAEDGTLYGTAGIGLLEKTVKQNLPVSDFLNENACFILAADFNGSGKYTPLFHTGPFYRRLGTGDITASNVRTVGYNLYEFTVENGLECISNVQELNLYNSGSPYREQKWALLSVVDEKEALEMYYDLVRTVLASIILTFLVCVLSAVITSRSLSLPVAKMVRKLEESQKNSMPVEFQPLGIEEIDVLADAVMDLQDQISKAKDDEYTAKLLEANAALKDAYAAATRASSAKTDFLSRMSHDIRTPMNAIIGMTAIAEKNLENPEKTLDCLSKISSSSQYLLGLINEVLDMSKIESGKFVLAQEPVNIVELADNLVEMVKHAAKDKQHQLNVHIHSIDHKYVIGDSMRIQQVFVNIMSNAIKYTPPGGHIDFTVLERDVGQKLVGCYEFIFEDDGIGMSPEFIKKAFDPFERAEDSRVNREQGTGLGLAITANIVKMMDGDIQVESEPGRGTKFTVTICLQLPDEADLPAEDAQAEEGQDMEQEDFTGVRALLVDDNELNREIASEILCMAGLEVEMAENGKQAVELFSAKDAGYYDIIFMDVQMPVMNGYEAAAAIRRIDDENGGHIPILAMTANTFAEDVEKSRNAGMDEHLAKPIDLDKLYEALGRWAGRRRREN